MDPEVPDATLPAILCFHGHGTNSTIFRYQIRRITQALGQSFRFIFLDAPFEVQHAGPGAHPAFSATKPFRRWQSDEAVATAFGVPKDQVANERRQVRDLVQGALGTAGSGTRGVVGVIAFSQGTRIATGLCLDPELGASIQFAVLICGLVPPAPLSDARPVDPGEGNPVRMLSLHIQGTLDPWRSQGQKLLETYFDRTSAQTVDFTGAHEVPGGVAQAADIARRIMQFWCPGEIASWLAGIAERPAFQEESD